MRFDGNKLVIKKELVEEDKLVPKDVRTMNILNDIGNTIFKCIQFTVDCPSMHAETNKVPVLDLQVSVESGRKLFMSFMKNQ